MGGPYGNTHLAVGMSYHDTYAGSTAGLSKSFFAKLGFNDSAVHTDMISTTDRTVTAKFSDGSKKVIYKNGQFTI
jgi:aminopeptidase